MMDRSSLPRSRRLLLLAFLFALASIQLYIYLRSQFARENNRFVGQVAYSPAGETLAWVSDGSDSRGTLVIWDAARNRKRLEIPCGGFDSAIGSNVACSFASLAFSPDGKTIATAIRSNPDAGPRVVCWKAETGEPTIVLPLDSEVVGPVFSTDGESFAGIGRDRAVKLCDPRNKKVIQATLRVGAVPATSIAFDPDGVTLATGWGDGVVRFWNIADREWRAQWSTQARGVSRLAYSPDGKTLAAAGSDGMLRLWDVAAGIEKSSHSGFANACRSIAFSPDGTILAMKFAETSVGVLWDVKNAKVLAGFPNASGGLAFAPDGRVLATAGGSKGKVYLVALPPSTSRSLLNTSPR